MVGPALLAIFCEQPALRIVAEWDFGFLF